MATPGFSATGGGKLQDQTSFPFHKFDIEMGTELWRKKLEGMANATKQTKRPRDVEGGIPPHLLKKSTNSCQLVNVVDGQSPSVKTTTEGGLAPHLLFKETSNPFPVVKTPNNPRTDLTTYSQLMSPTPLAQVNRDAPPQSSDSQQCEASAFSSKSPTGRPLNLRGTVPQHQHSPPTPKYEEQTAQSYMIGEANENKGYQQQSNASRQPVEAVEPVPGVVSGIRRKFKAKKSCDRESQSLPETISSIKSNDGGNARIYDVNDGREQLESVPFGDDPAQSVNEGSSEDNQDKIKQNSHGGTGSGTCEAWIRSMTEEPPAKCYFLEKQIDGHHECDVDPVNGVLLAPIDYPETHINPKDSCSGQESIRRLNGTAGLKSFADCERNKRQVQYHQQRQEQTDSGVRDKPRPVIQSLGIEAPPTITYPLSEGLNQQQNDEGHVPSTLVHLTGHGPAQVKPDSGNSGVQVSYFLRPAEEEDMPQILEIYNWEVKNGFQALDTQALVLKDIQNIFSRCRLAQTPFIVAVAGTAAEAAARKEVPARPRPYRTQPTGPYKQTLHESRYILEPDSILGFGFLSIPVTGLAGNIQHSVYRFQARAHFYVDNKHRRKGIGRALLHKLTRCSSIYSVDMGTYEWFDPPNSRVCDLPSFNPRNYSRLFVETASRSENDSDTLWYSKFLDSEGFLCISTLDKARKIGDSEDGQWVDNLVWQLDCQNPQFLTENHRNPYNL